MGQEIAIKLSPFLKWAGGKRWLASTFSLADCSYQKYFEPFLGGGAMYFAANPNRAVLSDINQDLIETYKCIRDDPENFSAALGVHARNHSSEYYYKIRSSSPVCRLERAARFVYLNRTCWNGLYRVNQKGEFNVPIGTKTSVLLATDNWIELSSRLSKAALFAQDFELTIDAASGDDLIFADPPYTVKHNLNGFVKYNESIFSWDDQVRLAAALERAALRGVKVIATNAAHASVKKLYADDVFLKANLSRASVLAGSSAARGRFDELLITANYDY